MPDPDASMNDLPGSLSVVRPAGSGASGGFETFIKITADGSVTAFNGHVDLGTGIRTALGQIVAEELDVSFARVIVVLGDTAVVPNQGATIASETIQITAVPLRKAAAQARHFLVARAAQRLELAVEDLVIEDGLIRGRDNRSVSYGELISGETIRLELADDVPVKAVERLQHRRAIGAAHRHAGEGDRRTGLCARHARARHAARPRGAPALCRRRSGDFVGNTLDVGRRSVDRAHPRHASRWCVIRDFVGIVAEREEHAEQALRELQGDAGSRARRCRPGRHREGAARQPVDAAPAGRRGRCRCRHCCGGAADAAHLCLAVPDARVDRPVLRAGRLASDGRITGVGRHAEPARAARRPGAADGPPDSEIDVVRMEAAGCYGRNGADDVAADAALLSRAVGAPVRVQLTREQEHAWEPKGAAQLMDVNGGLDADGGVAGLRLRDLATRRTARRRWRCC